MSPFNAESRRSFRSMVDSTSAIFVLSGLTNFDFRERISARSLRASFLLTDSRSTRDTVTVAASPRDAWEAWVNPARVTNFLGEQARIDLLAATFAADEPAFREAIFSGTGRIDPAAIQAEVVRQTERLVTENERIAAILFECANLPPYAAAVQKAVGLPVYDFTTMVCHVHAALVRTAFS